MIQAVLLGDCREVINDIEDDSIDLIILDPPYMVTREKWDKEEVINVDFVKSLYRVLKSTGNLYIWCGIGEKSQSLIRWFPLFQGLFTFKDLITWKKRRGIGTKRGWLYVREEIMWFVKDNKKFIWNKEWQYNHNEKNEFKKGFSGYECLSKFKRFSNVWVDIPEILNNKQIQKMALLIVA